MERGSPILKTGVNLQPICIIHLTLGLLKPARLRERLPRFVVNVLCLLTLYPHLSLLPTRGRRAVSIGASIKIHLPRRRNPPPPLWGGVRGKGWGLGVAPF
jgi:hypothetical protein